MEMPDTKNLMNIQFTRNYHPVFILLHLVQILSGLATILITFWILAREYDEDYAIRGTAVIAFFPLCILYFPNLHHDSILVPFALLSVYFFLKERFVMAGIFFGLAMASKNTAIILGFAFAALMLWQAWRERKSLVSVSERKPILRRLKGLATVGIFGLLLLLPFANPVAYVNEILTPISHREYDSRAVDNPTKYCVSTKLANMKSESSVYSVVRPELQLTSWLLYFDNIGFFFLFLTVILFLNRPQTPLTMMCFYMLLLMPSYSIIFGEGMCYRTLLFVPFFTILFVDAASKRHFLIFTAMLLFLDFMYCYDPITCNEIHRPVNNQKLWTALFGSFSKQ
jgi:4-amino-4-deoxy-L-arabinose transferase-like glycosyltransferase